VNSIATKLRAVGEIERSKVLALAFREAERELAVSGTQAFAEAPSDPLSKLYPSYTTPTQAPLSETDKNLP
tara:strand:+ start:6531 stop:6743 length:213 start_codon:yes stop_codon:yes gene_type:complete